MLEDRVKPEKQYAKRSTEAHVGSQPMVADIERVYNLKANLVPKSVRVTSLVGRGRAADVIVNTAEEKGVDLIVLSTHGHTGLNRLLMGSVAEHVVRHAKCPVYVVRKT